ncbi:hypothetical protein [Cohnella hashimotonis]|uniref:LPXTG cell wall anchor domain-containing protein n=1 Tax=Cohnella hashimotonis TaxID=2826895 RepID=A0ABT6TNB8_9BACL|nr:hypothetical protein [Cohnella hashimotonis]MDI4647753.1 hypothetical protein [Cohnella hashimotonis]
MLIAIVAAVLLAGAGGAFWLGRRRRKRAVSRSAKVVPFRAARKRPGKRRESAAGEQARPCSLCRARNSRLSFYIDESGRTIGVCKDCRPKAEARELDRL